MGGLAGRLAAAVLTVTVLALPWLIRAIVTVAFSASGAVHVWRCVAGSSRRPGNGVELVNDLFHLLMSVEMVTMAWRAPLGDRWGLQLTVFAVATGWFLVQAIAPLPVGSQTHGVVDVPGLRCRAPARPSPRTVGGRVACLQHAILAAAMTWMIAGMSPADGVAATPVAGPATGHMTSMAMSTASAAVDGAAQRYMGAWLGGYLLLSASSWLVVAYRIHRRRKAAPRVGRSVRATGIVSVEAASGAISYAVMAGGMGAVLLAGQVLAAP